MCGRSTHKLSWDEIVRLYNLTLQHFPKSNLEPNYNVAPTTTIPIVIEQNGKRGLVPARWGLIPSWWKKPLKELPATFNARAETVATKPMFRSAYAKRRCIIPSSGFYEWKGPKGKKQPYFILPARDPLLSFAGLWEQWKDPETNMPLNTATIIVTAAQEPISELHDRMPVMLASEDFEPWLSLRKGIEELAARPPQPVNIWPVSSRVNKVGNNGDETLTHQIQLAA